MAAPTTLPPCRHLRVQLGDPALVKHMLDEQAAMYLLDQGYSEDVTLSNIKIGVGIFSVVLTLVAQFAPIPFPESATFLKGCVLLYFLLQGALQLMHVFIEKDAILVTKPREDAEAEVESPRGDGKKAKKGNSPRNAVPVVDTSVPAHTGPIAIVTKDAVEALPACPISLQATLERYETDYHVTLSTRPAEPGSRFSTSRPQPQVSVSATLQITDYFDVNGVFLLERYQASLRRLLQEYADQSASIAPTSKCRRSGGKGKSANSKKKE